MVAGAAATAALDAVAEIEDQLAGHLAQAQAAETGAVDARIAAEDARTGAEAAAEQATDPELLDTNLEALILGIGGYGVKTGPALLASYSTSVSPALYDALGGGADDTVLSRTRSPDRRRWDSGST